MRLPCFLRWRENWQESWSSSPTPKQEQYVSNLTKTDSLLLSWKLNLLSVNPDQHTEHLIVFFFPSVFSQGEEGTSWYIILKGSVNVVIYGKVGISFTSVMCSDRCLTRWWRATGRRLYSPWRRRLWEAGSRQRRSPRRLHCPARRQLSLPASWQRGLQQDFEGEFPFAIWNEADTAAPCWRRFGGASTTLAILMELIILILAPGYFL